MNNWTSSTRTRLEEYFTRVRSELQATGADVEEVTEDLRRHVEQEAAALKPHAHEHAHTPTCHAHPHYPDLHHTHEHDPRESS